MVDGRMLTDKSKEELIRIILEKDKLVDELERENKELREKIKAEQQKRNEKFAKPNAPKKRRMRPGQKLGHVGMTRSVPPDFVNGTPKSAFLNDVVKQLLIGIHS